ncbi:MAG: MarR family transcriptional regulator [Caulobacteraceae bacterium]|nr:MarR family transcriptional regulator [Caulobacteraceae bacterium]
MGGMVAIAQARPERISRPAAEPLAQGLEAAAAAVGTLTARTWKERFGLTVAEWRAMARLAEAESQALAHESGPEEQRILRGLLHRGLVEGGPLRFGFTPEGRRLHEEIAPLAQAYEATLVTDLSPGEVIVLKLLLRRLTVAAERLGGERR